MMTPEDFATAQAQDAAVEASLGENYALQTAQRAIIKRATAELTKLGAAREELLSAVKPVREAIEAHRAEVKAAEDLAKAEEAARKAEEEANKPPPPEPTKEEKLRTLNMMLESTRGSVVSLEAEIAKLEKE